MTSSDAIEIKDAFVFCEYIFSLYGIWPQQHAPVLFTAGASYLLLSLGLVMSATADYLNDFIFLVLNISETVLTISIIPPIFIIRLSKSMKRIIDHIKKEIAEDTFYENDEEKRLYYRYNNISYKFGKYASIFQLCIVMLMFFRPLIHILVHSYTGRDNVTESYQLPFTYFTFIDYKYNARLFFPLYVFEFGATYVAIFHIGEVSFIVTLVLHVCGKFSILSSRIQKVPTNSSNLYLYNIKRIVDEHLELRKLSATVNENLYMILLIEYVSCIFRLSLGMYVTITMLRVDPVASSNFMMYSVDVLALLFFYSYVGEQLANESQNVAEALYSIEWQEVLKMNRDGRSFLICLMNGQKPEYMTAGSIYKFTLFGYTDNVKCAMAFLSTMQARMD